MKRPTGGCRRSVRRARARTSTAVVPRIAAVPTRTGTRRLRSVRVPERRGCFIDLSGTEGEGPRTGGLSAGGRDVVRDRTVQRPDGSLGRARKVTGRMRTSVRNRRGRGSLTGPVRHRCACASPTCSGLIPTAVPGELGKALVRLAEPVPHGPLTRYRGRGS